MKIMVTGSEGFIGAHLSKELHDCGHEVVSVDIKNDAFYQDMRRPQNIERLLRQHRPDRVVHLAARVGRLFGEDDLAETVADNAAMTAIVAQACGYHAVPLCYASTSEVYGDHEDEICYESRPFDTLPHNLYGLSKRWGEEACDLYAPDGLLKLRLSMPYGPGLPWGRGRAAIINFLHQAETRQEIPVHRGSERSWCWVGDTVRAISMLIHKNESGAYNIGRSDAAMPMTEVAMIACDLAGASYDLIHEVDPPARQTVVKRLSTRRIYDLGWAPQVEITEGMARCLAWIREQMEQHAWR